MKSTGVIRRVDDLGRIVIPKEIRNNMRIKSGEGLEIFTDDECLILKKFSPIENLESLATKYTEAIYQVVKHNIIVTDLNKVIAISGNLKKKYLNNNISPFVGRSIERRDSFVERQKKEVEIIENVKEYGYYSFSSIVLNGDILGSVIILSTETPLIQVEEKMAEILSKLISGSISI